MPHPEDRADESTAAPDPRVRPARSADAPAIRSLQSRLREPSPTLLAAALDGLVGTLLVSVAEREVVGYLLGVAGGGALADTADTADTAHVAELVVVPDHRREGRASGLLATFEGLVSAPLTVTVAADDERARSFYAAVGFEERRRLAETFDEGDALLLRRGV